MGFPFLAPLPPWTVDIMEQREENKTMTTYKNPWVVLTSGALVVKGKASKDAATRRKELVDKMNNPGNDAFKGCIISTNINDMELMYSLGKTCVGIDFDGKSITVDGESGRKVSTPTILSVDIDTDGANNTLKTATVSVKCYTLKQLEMFELFFMKPGMNVMIEFGDSSLLKSALYPLSGNKSVNSSIGKKQTYNTFRNGEVKSLSTISDIRDAMIKKSGNYDDWCEEFSDYYRSDSDAIARYIDTIEKSLGTYDYVAGKVLDYSFTIAEDSTYDVNFEISQGNQVSLAIPHSRASENSKDKTQPADKDFRTASQIIEMMITDFRMGDGASFKKLLNRKHPEDKKNWEDDWFNFLKINQEQKDTIASDDAYVSLRFVLEILMNYVLSGKNVDEDFFKFNLQNYTNEAGKKIYAIPVSSHKYMMSSNDDIIYPTAELPKLKAPLKDAKGNPPVKKEDNIIKISDKEVVDGVINGYDFHIKEKLFIPNHPTKGKIEAKASNRIGNALNIFIKYEYVVKSWNTTYTRIDFLEKILSLINSNSYGLFTLIYGIQEQNSVPTVLDAKLTNVDDVIIKQNEPGDVYRFKPTTLKSNVKQFSFNFEMSNLVAGRQIFNSGKLLAEAKSNTTDVGQFPLPDGVYKAVDNATMGNADGFYSINNVEFRKLQKNFEQIQKRVKDNADTAVESDENESATTEAEDLTEVIANKSTNFLLNRESSNIKTLIFKDKSFITKYINEKVLEEGNKKSTLSPIQVTITLDGFSGFTPGQYFKIDGIPEIYNQVGVFQITNTKHSITTEGWDTTIEADHRII
jgi:hypothetical protein